MADVVSLDKIRSERAVPASALQRLLADPNSEVSKLRAYLRSLHQAREAESLARIERLVGQLAEIVEPGKVEAVRTIIEGELRRHA